MWLREKIGLGRLVERKAKARVSVGLLDDLDPASQALRPEKSSIIS